LHACISSTSINTETSFTMCPGKQSTLFFQGTDDYDLRDQCQKCWMSIEIKA
jgi:hypothetical protein